LPRGGHKIQGNKQWALVYSSTRDDGMDAWFLADVNLTGGIKEQGQRDEQCSSDAASCQTGLIDYLRRRLDWIMQVQVTRGQFDKET
jgi:hypothetical protein